MKSEIVTDQCHTISCEKNTKVQLNKLKVKILKYI